MEKNAADIDMINKVYATINMTNYNKTLYNIVSGDGKEHFADLRNFLIKEKLNTIWLSRETDYVKEDG